MKQKLLFIFCIVLTMNVVAAAQTVTNADLEKYRQDRLRAERDLDQNYVRLGFVSPAERERREKENWAETARLSASLRERRLRHERLEMYREAAEATARFTRYGSDSDGRYYASPYIFSYGATYRVRRGPIRGRLQQPRQSGYFAGGKFWPAPLSPKTSAPLFRRVK